MFDNQCWYFEYVQSYLVPPIILNMLPLTLDHMLD